MNKANLFQTSLAVAVFALMTGCGQSNNSAPPSAASANGFATTPQPCNVQNLPGYPVGAIPGHPGAFPGSFPGYGVPGVPVQGALPNPPNNCTPNLGPITGPHGPVVWPQQPNLGFQQCGCPFGHQPNLSHLGFACVPTAYFGGGVQPWTYGLMPQAASGVQYWNHAQNTQTLNIPQQYYHNLPQSCHNQISRGCDTSIPSSCGATGQQCMPIGAGSRFGVCTF